MSANHNWYGVKSFYAPIYIISICVDYRTFQIILDCIAKLYEEMDDNDSFVSLDEDSYKACMILEDVSI